MMPMEKIISDASLKEKVLITHGMAHGTVMLGTVKISAAKN